MTMPPTGARASLKPLLQSGAATIVTALLLVVATVACAPPDADRPGSLDRIEYQSADGAPVLTVDQVTTLAEGACTALTITDHARCGTLVATAVTVVDRESGRDPNAIGRPPADAEEASPDAHERTGFGLGQLLPATFADHHHPGTSWNILDPQANVTALMSYLRTSAPADPANRAPAIPDPLNERSAET